MPAIQTSYTQTMRPGRPGLVVNMETQNSITRLCETPDGIGFGLPVVQGVSDKGALLLGSEALIAAAVAAAGNTGNGTITAAPTAGAGAQAGVYTLVAEETPAANGGSFRMENPDGEYLGTVKVGVPATLGGIGPFTIADGATDFATGDSFRITVDAEEGGTAFRGYTIEDKTLVRSEGTPVDTFRKGDNMGLLVDGVIWVVAGGAVKAGNQAFFDPTTKRHVAAGGRELPNVTFETSATANGELVQVRVSHL